MKRNIKHDIFGLLGASALLLTAACADSLSVEQPGTTTESEDHFVTFTIDCETQAVKSRAVTYPGEGELDRISDGSKATKLIFAVYSKTSGGTTYELDKDYRSESDEYKGDVDGQNVMNVEKFPVTIRLRTKEGYDHKVAFWAQSPNADVFDTSDLTKVGVKYESALNNDELRDAFCASEEFSTESEATSVLLKRPFAQVNVGTAGYDYEGMAALDPKKVIFNESQITLKGVSKFYNILENKALASTDLTGDDATTDVTFAFSTLPAFRHLSSDQLQDLKATAYHKDILYPDKDSDGNIQWESEKIKMKSNDYTGEEEEFLKVKLDEDDDNYKRYIGWEEYLNYKRKDQNDFDTDNYQTEVLKYLSMCYVLVPEATDLSSNSDITGVTYGSVLTNVKFEMRGDEIVDEGKEPVNEDGKINFSFELNNVPVQKNWRTNIVSNGLLLVNTQFYIDIVPDYCGDYNNLGGTVDDWQNNVDFVPNERNGWKLKDPNAGNKNNGFNDPAGDYDKPQTGGQKSGE